MKIKFDFFSHFVFVGKTAAAALVFHLEHKRLLADELVYLEEVLPLGLAVDYALLQGKRVLEMNNYKHRHLNYGNLTLFSKKIHKGFLLFSRNALLPLFIINERLLPAAHPSSSLPLSLFEPCWMGRGNLLSLSFQVPRGCRGGEKGFIEFQF